MTASAVSSGAYSGRRTSRADSRTGAARRGRLLSRARKRLDGHIATTAADDEEVRRLAVLLI